MRFSKIKLENWRNFGTVDVALQHRAFLVGPNAVGKSNFLDVFRFLRDLVIPGGGFQKAISDRGGVSRIRNLAARRAPAVTIEVELSEGENVTWRYRLSFSQTNQSQPILKEEKGWRGNQLILDRPDAEDQQDKARLGQTFLEQTFANRDVREIATFFGSIRALSSEPPCLPTGRADEWLWQVAAHPARRERLRWIEGMLQRAIPQLARLAFDESRPGTPHLRVHFEHWHAPDAWQDDDDFSEGTRHLIRLLWVLVEGAGPRLLEAPERALHPEIVRFLPQGMLRAKKPTPQTLVSTHSSELLRELGISADEMLLLRPSPAGSTVTSGAEIAEMAALFEVGLSAADVVLPHTRPPHAVQLAMLPHA